MGLGPVACDDIQREGERQGSSRGREAVASELRRGTGGSKGDRLGPLKLNSAPRFMVPRSTMVAATSARPHQQSKHLGAMGHGAEPYYLSATVHGAKQKSKSGISSSIWLNVKKNCKKS